MERSLDASTVLRTGWGPASAALEEAPGRLATELRSSVGAAVHLGRPRRAEGEVWLPLTLRARSDVAPATRDFVGVVDVHRDEGRAELRISGSYCDRQGGGRFGDGVQHRREMRQLLARLAGEVATALDDGAAAGSTYEVHVVERECPVVRLAWQWLDRANADELH